MLKENMKKYMTRHKWLIWGICVSLLAAAIYTCFYKGFKEEAEASVHNPLETVESMSFLYKNCYVLYRDLHNSQNEEKLGFAELYLQPVEGADEKLLEQLRYFESHGYTDEEGYVHFSDEEVEELAYDGGLTMEAFHDLTQIVNKIERDLGKIEDNFSSLNAMFDFVAEDMDTGEIITNLTDVNISEDEQAFLVSFLFDESGNVTVDGAVKSMDATKVRKNANEAIRSFSLQKMADNQVTGYQGDYQAYHKFARLQMPVNCRITFMISNEDWLDLVEDNYCLYYDSAYSMGVYYNNPRNVYNNTASGEIYLSLLLVMFLLAFLFPTKLLGDGWKKNKLCNPFLEILIAVGLTVIGFGTCVVDLVCWVCSGDGVSSLNMGMPGTLAVLLVYSWNLLALTILLCGAWYVGVCARMLREMGMKEYFKKYCGFYQIFPYLKKKLRAVYEEAVHFDVTKKANKFILKIVIINAVILFVIGSLWVGGFGIAIVYSLILYFFLRKYISDLQKKYSVLLKATNEIAEGNLQVDIREDLGVFEPFKPQVIRIQNGFRNAVDEEVKSQRLKSELITNVSHDLKTPLTAIITYINLLQEDGITVEQRKEYLNTLERKSLRLKVLIEDLFEVSKATSQNITLNIMDVDIVNLVKQVRLEMSDKLDAAKLDIRMQLPKEKCILPLDSQKTYRIYENLFGNIAKYALPGTRVYVSGNILPGEDDGEMGGIEITLKNITAEELQITPEELTERFVRGDVSRNTEGSGLGLAIAKSFTELQGGKFDIQIDGDLFKVTTVWKM